MYCGLYFAIKEFTIKTEKTEHGIIKEIIVYPEIVRVSSSGPAAELYPDSLGDYHLLPDNITLNDLPVYQHSARDDRFIISNGNLIISSKSVTCHFISANFWFITHEISNSGLREFSSVRQEEQLTPDLGWQYNRYPNCRTVQQCKNENW